MGHRFGDVELEPAKRALRRDGVLVEIQPQVFDLLAYLVDHRDRVVPKSELLTTLWPDTFVTESSLQRAVSLARRALGDDRSAIKTYPRKGYRFVGKLETDGASQSVDVVPGAAPAVRYAHNDDVHLAYCTIGDGPVDVVIVWGWAFPMMAAFERAETRAFCDGLARRARVIMFDKRGTGLSDRIKDLPPEEKRGEDLASVLDAAGSRRAVVVGISEGGSLAIGFAARYPRRVRGLALIGAFARMRDDPGVLVGWTEEQAERLREYLHHDWGRGRTIISATPSLASEAGFVRWAARAERSGASPGAALDLLEMNWALDVRGLLGDVLAPTVVVHALGDQVIPVTQGRALAESITGARLVELDGDDHVPLRQVDKLVDEIGALW